MRLMPESIHLSYRAFIYVINKVTTQSNDRDRAGFHYNVLATAPYIGIHLLSTDY